MTVPLSETVLEFIQDVSPATGVAWTPAELEAMEYGIESA